MVDSSYDQAIGSAKTQLDQHQQRVEDLASKYDEVVTRFLVEWASDLKDRALSDKPEVAKKQGGENLGRVKTEFNELLEKYPVMTAEALKEHGFWPHRESLPGKISSEYDFELHELETQHMRSVDQAVRELIGHVAVILARHGFVDTNRDSQWEVVSGGRLRYSYGIPIHSSGPGKEVGDLKKAYGEALKDWAKASIELRKSTHAKEAAEAKGLWDKA